MTAQAVAHRAGRCALVTVCLLGTGCGTSTAQNVDVSGGGGGGGGSQISNNDAGAGGASDPGTGGAPDVGVGGADASAQLDGSGLLSRPTRLAVPAYFYPGPDWNRLIAAAPTVGMIVFNPNSGPGMTSDPAYTKALADAKAAGITVLGYVATSYGTRPAVDVLNDINRYYDLYSPSGIYLAEGPMEADCTPLEAEYHQYAAAARSRDENAYMAVGTRFCPTYVYFFDLMVQFARTWEEYQTYMSPSWMPKSRDSRDRFAHFVHTVPAASASEALSRVVANGAGWVFATDQMEPNPWNGLPSYFDEEVRAVAASQR